MANNRESAVERLMRAIPAPITTAANQYAELTLLRRTINEQLRLMWLDYRLSFHRAAVVQERLPDILRILRLVLGNLVGQLQRQIARAVAARPSWQGRRRWLGVTYSSQGLPGGSVTVPFLPIGQFTVEALSQDLRAYLNSDEVII